MLYDVEIYLRMFMSMFMLTSTFEFFRNMGSRLEGGQVDRLD